MAVPVLSLSVPLACALAVLLRCAQSERCSAATRAYGEMGFSAPENRSAGEQLQVCLRNQTCCSAEMEQNFVRRSKHELQKFLDEATEELRNTFESRHGRFDEFFLSLLEKTEGSLNEMFVRTYGEPYMQNADIFRRLFSELKRFYSGENVNLDEMLNDFWTKLMERMFQLLNSQYDINDDYMECVNKHMDDLKPFGEIPRKVKGQVTRAFLVARTFVQGLEFGLGAANNFSKVSISEECASNITDMLYCPYCEGQLTAKPCAEFCVTVLRTCLREQTYMDTGWTKFIDAMLLLIDRLEGPFNIESVMEPIDVKISDAIMNMQDKTMELSYQVFEDCGQPKLLEKPRLSRDVTEELHPELRPELRPELPPTTSPRTNLQRLVIEMKGKLTEFKNFWSSLPELICQGESVAAVPEQNHCWNGTHPNWNVSHPSVVFDTEMTDFSYIIIKLTHAYNGQQLQYDDTSDELSGSGSGSGCVDTCATPSWPLNTNQPDLGSSSPPLHHTSSLLFLLLTLTWLLQLR